MGAKVTIDDTVLKQIQADDAGRDRWLRGVGNQILGDIVKSFGDSPPGQQYGDHVASQPGYPPNVDDNVLRPSMKLQKIRKLNYQIQDGTDYGIKLEDGIGVEARPFVRPVFDEWQIKIEGEAKDGLVPAS